MDCFCSELACWGIGSLCASCKDSINLILNRAPVEAQMCCDCNNGSSCFICRWAFSDSPPPRAVSPPQAVLPSRTVSPHQAVLPSRAVSPHQTVLPSRAVSPPRAHRWLQPILLNRAVSPPQVVLPPVAVSPPQVVLPPVAATGYECCICLEETKGPFMICICQGKTCVGCALKNGASGADIHKCPCCRSMMIFPDGHEPRGNIRARNVDDIGESDSDDDSDDGFVLAPRRVRPRVNRSRNLLSIPMNLVEEVFAENDYASRSGTGCGLLNTLRRRIPNYSNKSVDLRYQQRYPERAIRAKEIVEMVRDHCLTCQQWLHNKNF